jgi:hypothetical protein
MRVASSWSSQSLLSPSLPSFHHSCPHTISQAMGYTPEIHQWMSMGTSKVRGGGLVEGYVRFRCRVGLVPHLWHLEGIVETHLQAKCFTPGLAEQGDGISPMGRPHQPFLKRDVITQHPAWATMGLSSRVCCSSPQLVTSIHHSLQWAAFQWLLGPFLVPTTMDPSAHTSVLSSADFTIAAATRSAVFLTVSSFLAQCFHLFLIQPSGL